MRHYAAKIRQTGDATVLEMVTSQPHFQDGSHVTVTVVSRRSHRQHRAFWAMLRFASDHSDLWQTPEECLLWLKAEFGLYRVMELADRRILEFKSVSFHDMGTTEFKELFDRAVKRISEEIGVDPLQFMEEARR